MFPSGWEPAAHPQFLPTCKQQRIERYVNVTIKRLTTNWCFVWQSSQIVLTMIGVGMAVIRVCDLGHHSLAAARASLCHLRRDSQPGYCVSAAVVAGLDGSKKRRDGVKHRDRLIFSSPEQQYGWRAFSRARKLDGQRWLQNKRLRPHPQGDVLPHWCWKCKTLVLLGKNKTIQVSF